MTESYNFSPGPSMLPKEVMIKAKDNFLDFHYGVSSGMSALEISHRDPVFIELLNTVNNKLRKLLNIPSNYKLLWTTGGASLQFDLIAQNLLINKDKNIDLYKNNYTADYYVTGYWSDKAANAASKYINVNKVIDQKNAVSLKNINNIKNINNKSDNLLYIYFTYNETISGLSFKNNLKDIAVVQNYYNNLSDLSNIPLVADMTSCILSEPIDVSKYDIIFAAAQKNLGSSGVTLVIIKDNLLSDNLLNNSLIPDLCNYRLISDGNSLLNTLPTYNIYIINLVLDWIQEQGGVDKIYSNNIEKAKKLYSYIDSSNIYSNKIDPKYRSLMNVIFDIKNTDNVDINNVNNKFLSAAEHNKLFNLEGHRSLGGMRASIYNSMPLAGIDKLISFMQKFEDNYN